MRPETRLQLEAGYIYADCVSSTMFTLALRRRTIQYQYLFSMGLDSVEHSGN
jgi:hypothetical protein